MQNHLRSLGLAAFAWYLISFAGAPSSVAVEEEPKDATALALHATLAKNLEHARGWLESKDFKSLAESAGELEMLAQVQRAQSDDPAWQQAGVRVVAAAKDARDAARDEDETAAREALKQFEESASAMKKLAPAGKQQPPPRVGNRPLMLLMEGVEADAKMALRTGNVAEAKQGAYVLAELGRIVAHSTVTHSRTPELWSQLGREFVESSLAVARSPSENATQVRTLFRAVSERCEGCHNTKRQD